jgi:hypothetical protein
MRGASSVLIVFLVVVATAALYLFLGKAQLSRVIHLQEAELKAREAKVTEISKHEAEMAQLTQKLPVWRKQLTLFKQAIPESIDDHVFLAALNDQLKQRGVQLNTIQVTPVGSWLKDVDEKTIEAMKQAGLDVDTMRKVQVAYYAARLSGDFSQVVNAFESLKRCGRLYTIDLVTSDPGGGGGAVGQVAELAEHPVMLTGALFYGIPSDYVDVASLERVFSTRYARPLARGVYQEVLKQAQELDGGAAPKGAAGEASQAGATKPPPATSGAGAAGKPAAEGV